MEKITIFNKRRVFNKAVGPGKNQKLINVGPTSIPESRVHTLKMFQQKWEFRRFITSPCVSY